jgi:exopolysaccharide biosynthesis polyprenyl glycosylphosphotransferase
MIPRRFFWLFDMLAILLAFVGAYRLLPNLGPIFGPGGLLRTPAIESLFAPAVWTGNMPPVRELFWIILAMAPGTIVALGVLGNHRPLLDQSHTRILIGGMAAPFLGLSAMTVFLFAFKSWDWGRLFAFSFAALSGIFLSGYRLALRRYFLLREQAGYYAKNVLLIGLPHSVRWAIYYFAHYVSDRNYRVVGYLRVPPTENDKATVLERLPRDEDVSTSPPELGEPGDLDNLLIVRPINEVIAIHPVNGGEWITHVIESCDHTGIPLRILPEALILGGLKSLEKLYPFEQLHLPSVVLRPPHWDSDALFLKRLFDVLVTGLLLLIVMPIMLLIAIISKISQPKLPIFYPWRVVGKHGMEFTGYKFRTMVADADKLKADLMSLNEMKGPVFKIKNDPRITKLGRFLRKYSLDELPQLWSVIKGDMSLVGPRPAGPHELERYEFWHKRKLSILPGITCLWQVSGRNKINDFDQWVRMDFEYINNWSLWLDLKILARTAWVVIAGTGS